MTNDIPVFVRNEELRALTRFLKLFNGNEYSITMKYVFTLICNRIEELTNEEVLTEMHAPLENGKCLLYAKYMTVNEDYKKLIHDTTTRWESDCLTDFEQYLEDKGFEEKTYSFKCSSRKAIPGTIRQNVLMRDNYTCQICGATVEDGAKLEIDHIIPYSKGGTDKENNLQVLCRQCNREKHNRTDLKHDENKLRELGVI